MPRHERDRLTPPLAGWVRILLGTAILLVSACSASATSGTCCNGCGGGEANLPYQYRLLATPPVAVDGVVVVVTTAASYDPLVNRSASVITALRASDGSVLWQRPDPLSRYGGNVSVDNLSDDDGTLILNDMRGLSAVRPSDGTVLWQTRLESSMPPVFDGDVIYTRNSQGLSATRLSDGQLLGQWQLSVLAALPPVVSGGVIYAGSLESVLALRASDGVILWQTPVPSAIPTPTPIPNPTGRNHLYVPGPSPGWVQPLAVVGDHLYVSADQGRLLLVRTKDGQVDGQIASNLQSHTVVPILIDGTLYLAVTDVAPTTFAWQTSEQQLLWRLPLGAPGVTIVAAKDGVIYLNDGSLLAIRLTDGTVLWHTSLAHGLAGSGGGQLFFSDSVGYIDICPSRNAQLATVTALGKTDGSISWVTHIPAVRS